MRTSSTWLYDTQKCGDFFFVSNHRAMKGSGRRRWRLPIPHPLRFIRDVMSEYFDAKVEHEDFVSDGYSEDWVVWRQASRALWHVFKGRVNRVFWWLHVEIYRPDRFEVLNSAVHAPEVAFHLPLGSRIILVTGGEEIDLTERESRIRAGLGGAMPLATILHGADFKARIAFPRPDVVNLEQNVVMCLFGSMVEERRTWAEFSWREKLALILQPKAMRRWKAAATEVEVS